MPVADGHTSIPSPATSAMPSVRVTCVALSLLLLLATAAMSVVTTEPFDPAPGHPDSLGTYTHPAGGKTLALSVGVGSSAFRSPFDVLSSLTFFLTGGRIADAF